jgi:hypothetical protein
LKIAEKDYQIGTIAQKIKRNGETITVLINRLKKLAPQE